MLKLQSKGGKFDIVLSEATLQGSGSPQKKSIRSLSSAGRRKTKELKGNDVLKGQKEVSPRQQNVIKTKPLKSKGSNLAEDVSHDQQQAYSVTSRQAKHVASQKERQNSRQPNVNATKPRVKGKTTAAANRDKHIANIKKASSDVAQNENNLKNGAVISQAQLATLMEALRSGDTSVLQKVVSQDTQNATTESKAPHVTEPAFVPGLDLGSSPRKDETKAAEPFAMKRIHEIDHEAKTTKKADALSIGTVSVTSRNELQAISYSSTPTQGIQGSSTAQLSSRADPVAMRSSFAIGAPGQVAYNYDQQKRDKSKQYLADLERQIQSKKTLPLSDKERFIRAMEDPASQPMTSRYAKSTQSSTPQSKPTNTRDYSVEKSLPHDHRQEQLRDKDISREIPHEPNTAVSEQSERDHSFGGSGRQAKSQFELDEIERRRIKHLEHQRAVQEQVEEKRRLKMEERERQLREEKESEEKLAREREMLQLQFEEEMKRQQAREEAEKQRQLALQKSVLEAYETAKQEKQNSLLMKLRAGGHDISHLQHDEGTGEQGSELGSESVIETKLHLLHESNEMPSQQYSSRSDKGFRPILNLTDEVYEEKKKQSNTKQTKKEIKKQNINKSTKTESNVVAEKTRKHSDSRKKQEERASIDSKKHRSSIDSKKSSRSEPVSDRRVKKSNKPNSKEEKTRNVSRREAEAAKEKIRNTENKKKHPKKSKAEVLSIETEVIEKPSIEVDNFGYKRSSTVTLHEDDTIDSEHQDIEVDERRYSQHEYKDEYSNWDSWSIPTSRQQQILEQLRTLRKGLMDKQREYERGTTPSSSLF